MPAKAGMTEMAEEQQYTEYAPIAYYGYLHVIKVIKL